MRILQADARDIPLADASIDAIVCDPPYELGFMGKGWDSAGVAFNPATWAEALRVAKPGAHLLAFGGTRTYHRLAVAIEDAGWEIRDCLMWLYGSGFPKSLDVGKAIDRARYDREQILRVTRWINAAFKAAGVSYRTALGAFGFNEGSGHIGHWTARTIGAQPAVPTLDQIPTLLAVLGDPDVPPEIADLIWTLNGRKGQPGENWAKREKVGESTNQIHLANLGDAGYAERWDITEPATDAARQWDGFGTALKPAWEIIILARKPLTGTVAQNVQAHGTGALNIDGSRIGSESTRRDTGEVGIWGHAGRIEGGSEAGRWPANLLLDEAAAARLDAEAGERIVNTPGQLTVDPGFGSGYAPRVPYGYGDRGGPSRFFYTAKASRTEREAGLLGLVPCAACAGLDSESHPDKAGTETVRCRRNDHPTVKPIDLMRYLCTLITPPGGLILDPFMGSGSTGMAALDAGFRFVGIDQDPHYVEIAQSRIARRHLLTPETREPTPETAQGALF